MGQAFDESAEAMARHFRSLLHDWLRNQLPSIFDSDPIDSDPKTTIVDTDFAILPTPPIYKSIGSSILPSPKEFGVPTQLISETEVGDGDSSVQDHVSDESDSGGFDSDLIDSPQQNLEFNLSWPADTSEQQTPTQQLEESVDSEAKPSIREESTGIGEPSITEVEVWDEIGKMQQVITGGVIGFGDSSLLDYTKHESEGKQLRTGGGGDITSLDAASPLHFRYRRRHMPREDVMVQTMPDSIVVHRASKLGQVVFHVFTGLTQADQLVLNWDRRQLFDVNCMRKRKSAPSLSPLPISTNWRSDYTIPGRSDNQRHRSSSRDQPPFLLSISQSSIDEVQILMHSQPPDLPSFLWFIRWCTYGLIWRCLIKFFHAEMTTARYTIIRHWKDKPPDTSLEDKTF